MLSMTILRNELLSLNTTRIEPYGSLSVRACYHYEYFSLKLIQALVKCIDLDALIDGVSALELLDRKLKTAICRKAKMKIVYVFVYPQGKKACSIENIKIVISVVTYCLV